MRDKFDEMRDKLGYSVFLRPKTPVIPHICDLGLKTVQKRVKIADLGLILVLFSDILKTFGHFCATF